MIYKKYLILTHLIQVFLAICTYVLVNYMHIYSHTSFTKLFNVYYSVRFYSLNFQLFYTFVFSIA